MINYDKVNEYITTMLLKSSSCAQLTNVALDDLLIRLYQKRICMMGLNT